ncbi:L-threonylcarbamoyladenylate synthase [Sideroxydans lithotrophicus]|uniref:Sua5/YciO/YrdC/YwlC family protein n=1 Tax=Sideroxydans lithotrophicus (strain ES-1) TaxID=580332 RepID=D5CSC6_SIDLE|nr:L-threonylcarbamoyladenylate synthase [Sideroxydans lithotrophicus]ADE11862.1 Sua5/YciO/YrdC/YwlC family protein [Sideroxydans lithotrophicus ES-1]
MAQFFTIHPENPQPRLIKQAAEMLRNGAVIVYPTDSGYALGCHLDDKDAVTRIRQIRGLDDKHFLTLMCRDLSELSHYARVDNAQFRLLKNNTPGSYTFILEATREVPRRLQHPKRSTVGLRIPDHPIALALLEELGEPLLSSTLILPDEEQPLTDVDVIREQLERLVELVIEGGTVGIGPTTVIDLTDATPVLVRRGIGEVAHLGIEE